MYLGKDYVPLFANADANLKEARDFFKSLEYEEHKPICEGIRWWTASVPGTKLKVAKGMLTAFGKIEDAIRFDHRDMQLDEDSVKTGF